MRARAGCAGCAAALWFEQMIGEPWELYAFSGVSYAAARKRYARLIPDYKERERRREARRSRPSGARHPKPGEQPRFGRCGRPDCPAAVNFGEVNSSWCALCAARTWRPRGFTQSRLMVVPRFVAAVHAQAFRTCAFRGHTFRQGSCATRRAITHSPRPACAGRGCREMEAGSACARSHSASTDHE